LQLQQNAIDANAVPPAASPRPWDQPITKPLKLVKHNATRWNSKARMLIRFCRIYAYVKQTLLHPEVLPSLPVDYMSTFPTPEDVEALKRVLPAVSALLVATDYLQADMEPTLGQVLPWMTTLKGDLGPAEDDPLMVRDVKVALWNDIVRRFDANVARTVVLPNGGQGWLLVLLGMATLLTPEFKCESDLFKCERRAATAGVKTLISFICRDDGCCVTGCRRAVARSVDAAGARAGVAVRVGPFRRSTVDPDTESSTKYATSLDEMFAHEWGLYQRMAFKTEDEAGDFVGWGAKWWRAHSDKFPHVAEAARRVLCIPATSASSERLFSCAGLILTPLRNRLQATRLEKLTMLSCNDPDEWSWDQWMASK